MQFGFQLGKILALALVAVAFGAAHADKGLSDSLDLSLSKGEATAAASQATAAAVTSGVTVLSAPRCVDLSIKKEKVPLLTVSDAPCKKICKDKCTFTMEKQCLTVRVPNKRCDVEKKTITKQFCEKKCKPSLKLDLPEFKLPTLPQDAPANPNPSAPPAAVAEAAVARTETQASLLKLSKTAALSASAGDVSAKVAGSAYVYASLAGATASVNVDVSASKDGRRLQGLIAHKLAKLPKADLDVECHDVCVDLPFVLPELKCTEQVEKCTKVPSKECKEECICLPQKSLSFNLPKKPALSVSVDASNSQLSVDASASSQRALKGLKFGSPKRFIKKAVKKVRQAFRA